MRIAFLGTPEFAVPSLKMLIEQGHEIEVFTQPDRPRDRGHGLAMPPVKAAALEAGIAVHQFERIKNEEGVRALKDFAPELMVTAAFGQILSRENLEIPKYGCINVHGQSSAEVSRSFPGGSRNHNGEKVTGVTTMLTDIGMDTGDMLLQHETKSERTKRTASFIPVLPLSVRKLCAKRLKDSLTERCREQNRMMRLQQNAQKLKKRMHA